MKEWCYGWGKHCKDKECKYEHTKDEKRREELIEDVRNALGGYASYGTSGVIEVKSVKIVKKKLASPPPRTEMI